MESLQPKGAMRVILTGVLDLLKESADTLNTQVYRQYQSGMPMADIARQHSLSDTRIMQIIDQTDARLAQLFAKHRLRLLFDFQPQAIGTSRLEALFIKLAAIYADARQQSPQPAPKRPPDAPQTPLMVLEDLTSRTKGILRIIGAASVEELCKLTPAEFLKARNSGEKSLQNLVESLAAKGFALKEEIL